MHICGQNHKTQVKVGTGTIPWVSVALKAVDHRRRELQSKGFVGNHGHMDLVVTVHRPWGIVVWLAPNHSDVSDLVELIPNIIPKSTGSKLSRLSKWILRWEGLWNRPTVPGTTILIKPSLTAKCCLKLPYFFGLGLWYAFLKWKYLKEV